VRLTNGNDFLGENAVHKSEQSKKSSRGQLLSWLPAAASGVLTIALIAKWSAAGLPRTAQGTLPAQNIQTAWMPEALGLDKGSWADPGIKEGKWSVNGSIWDFQNETIATAQLSSRLRQACETGPASDRAEHLAVIDLIPAARAEISQVGTLITRSIDFGTVQAAVLYREVDHHKSFVCAKIANPIDADRWQLITLSPKAMSCKTNDHLLPIDDLGVAVCQRFTTSGKLQCEIVETEHSMETLVGYWRFRGWIVKPFSSISSDATQIWNCSKGDQFVQVQSTQKSATQKSTLTITSTQNL